MLLIRTFKFDAAHNLIKYHGKCEKLHGHTYQLVVKLDGTPNEEDMIIDFAQLKAIVTTHVLQHLDHAYLNEVLEQPTAENIAVWVWQQLHDKFQAWENCRLFEIEVWETADCGVSYRGE